MAKVSIILPSFNHELFLRDRLNSILNQTFKDWQIIIIDDKSSDNSLQILTEFYESNKQKVKHFSVNESNSGSGYFSWKKGIELANTEYIWVAETDDYSDEKFLEEQIKALDQNNNCALSFCASVYVDYDQSFSHTSEKRTSDLQVPRNEYMIFDGKVLIDRMPFETYITNGSSVVFRKPKGGISSEIFEYRQCSDIFLWTFLVESSSFIFLNKELNYFRRHLGSTSIRLQKHHLESIYHEKANYLNYFYQTHKYPHFIEHYIKYYIWNNKKDFLNLSSVRKINLNKNLTYGYLCNLTNFVMKKILEKCKTL
jgi:glycosyltransferase involved in cell wall biosynthesis